MELLVPGGVGRDPRATLASVGEEDRHSRQRIARGFEQEALDGATLVRIGNRPDPIAQQLGLLAGAMGVRSQVVVTDDGRLPPDHGRRAMLLDDRVRIWPVSAHLLRIALVAEPRRRVFAIADARVSTEVTHLPTFFHCCTDTGIVFGSARSEVLRRAGDHIRDYDTPRPGAEAALVAALALADLLAVVGAYRSPFTHKRMPRCPEVSEIEFITGEPRFQGLQVLVEGCGGAGHGTLDPMLADALICEALDRGGWTGLVDPDRVSASNLARQLLFGGKHNQARPKAEVTAEEVRRRLPPRNDTEVEPLPSTFHAGMVQANPPHVVVLSPDSFTARESAWQAVRHRDGTLLLYLATEMTQAVERAVVAGEGVCLDCGPEELGKMAEGARNAPPPPPESPDEGRGGCGREFTASNVCTNAIAGARAALSLKRWLVHGDVEPRQCAISWNVPSRVIWEQSGDSPCSCWRSSR